MREGFTPPSRRLHPHIPYDRSTEDLSISSPPYQPTASTSSLHLESENFPPSPPYTSTPQVNQVSTENMDAHAGGNPEAQLNNHDAKSKPAVHYTDELGRGAGSGAPGFTRTDSTDLISSRPSSIAGTDDEGSEDYDWSGEEDLVDEEAKFEQRMGAGKTKPTTWGFKRIITLLFSTIIGSTFLAGVLVTPGVLVQIYWYKPNPTPQRLYIKDNIQAWLFWAAVNLVISWYLAMIVDIMPILVQLSISILWGHVSEYVKTRIEVYNSIKNNLKPLLYAASGWLSWIIIFGHIYDLYNTENSNESRATYTKRLQQVIEFFFFFALVICVKRMISHFIAFSFHRIAYQDRIEATQETLNVIETLRQYHPKPAPRSARKSPGARTPLFGSMGFSTPFNDSEHFSFLSNALRSATSSTTRQHKDYQHDDGEGEDTEDGNHTVGTSSWKGKEKKKDRLSWLQKGDGAQHETESYPLSPNRVSQFIDEGHSSHQYPPSPPTLAHVSSDESKSEVTLMQAAKVIKNAVLHDARNIGGETEGLGSTAWNVNSTQEAKRLARSIYTRFKDRRRTYLLPSDFYPAFPDETAAQTAFRVFDKDNNGDISRAEIKTTVSKVYRERRFLSRSMRDVGAALKTLDQIILLFSMIVLFFISISIFGVDVGDSLTSVYSIGIAASFIFKNSASSAFDAIMFLFVTHPYDTGDRCVIDEEVLVVKKVGLFATVFTRSDGTETYYFNSQLFTKFITNVRRSGKTSENLTMQIAWRTPLEKIDALETCLNKWLSTEENRWFEPSTSISLQHIEFQRYLSLTIGIGHNGYQLADWGLRWQRRTAFHAAVLYYCRQLEIICYESPIPIVYGDPQKRDFPQSLPDAPEIADDDSTPLDHQETEDAMKVMKPTMGFLPPLSNRSPQLTRARKSKGKKAVMRSMEGAGD